MEHLSVGAKGQQKLPGQRRQLYVLQMKSVRKSGRTEPTYPTSKHKVIESWGGSAFEVRGAFKLGLSSLGSLGVWAGLPRGYGRIPKTGEVPTSTGLERA